RTFQVQDDGTLPAVERREQLTRAAGRHRARGVALGRLELHHLRAEVREDERRVGPRSEPRQIQHPHTRERQTRTCPSLAGSAQVSSFPSFIARPMSMGLNFSFPCIAAICAFSCLLRIFTKS